MRDGAKQFIYTALELVDSNELHSTHTKARDFHPSNVSNAMSIQLPDKNKWQKKEGVLG
jgi:hypothetical protein